MKIKIPQTFEEVKEGAMPVINEINNRQAVTKRPPIIYQIEPTNDCNLACIMCPREKYMTRKIGYMDFNLYKEIIDKNAEFTEKIELCGWGEPLLHLNIVEMVKYATEKGIQIGITSNATYLTKTLSKKLVNAGLAFTCLDFSGMQNFEKIKVGATFIRTAKNIKNFLEIAGGKVFTIIQFIQMPENESDLDAWYAFWRKEWEMYHPNVMLRVKFYDSFAGTMGNKLKIKNRCPCPIAWQNVCILWNGDVVVCCRDFNGISYLGNVNKQPLVEIWNGQLMQEFRRHQLELDFPEGHLCKNCQEFYSWNEFFSPLLDIRPYLRGWGK